MSSHFSIGSSLSGAWSGMRGAKLKLWGAFITMLVIVGIFNLISRGLGSTQMPVLEIIGGVIMLLVAFFIQPQLMVGMLTVALRHVRGQPASVGQVFSGFKSNLFLNIAGFQLCMVLSSIVVGFVLYLIAVLFGLAFSISPHGVQSLSLIAGLSMLYGILMDYMAIPALADGKDYTSAFMFALKRLTPLRVIKLIILWIIVAIVLAISLIPICLGLIWTLPWMFTVQAKIYQSLNGQ